MRNRWLEYLLNNDPDKVLSSFGVRIRRFINPLLLKLIPLFSETKLCVVRKEQVPDDVPIIFASTHSFYDDVTIALKAIGSPVYLLFGSLPVFFNTINGISIWAMGTILVDRASKPSRAASKRKMVRAIELGADLLVYPEGVWNKTPNVCVQKLFPGIYDVAKEAGALVVPIGSISQDGTSYAILDYAFDITEYDRREGMNVLRDKLATLKYELMAEYATGFRYEFGYGEKPQKYWENHVHTLINSARPFYDYETENKAHYCVKGEASEGEVYASLLRSPQTRQNAIARARLCRSAPWLFRSIIV